MEKYSWELRILTSNGDGHGGGGTRPFLYLFAGLIIATKAKLVLEIGTGGALATKGFLRGLEITKGKIISCDPDAGRLGEFHHPRFTFINKTSNEVAKEWNQPIDVLFIDGDHRYKQAVLDYENFLPFVREKGLIVLHDTAEARYDGPYKMVREIKEFPMIVFDAWPGLAVFQKVTKKVEPEVATIGVLT